MKISISVIILTGNEELNLENCLKSIADLASQILIIDSYSTDRTLEIAKKYGADVVAHPFENQAKQFNWALDNLAIKNEWILRLDADEYLTDALKKEVVETLPNTPQGISGFLMKRRVYFMGRWIRHGGYYPVWLLRLFRTGRGKCEERAMDEHIYVTAGRVVKLKHDFVDDNKKGLKFWIQKHNDFSAREAFDLSARPGIRRTPQERIYVKLPLFLRAFLYFFYRYFLCCGFLDGTEGFIFHFLQGCWYRFLVDAKLYEEWRKRVKHVYLRD